MSWADLDAFLEHSQGRSAFNRLMYPVSAPFDDPVLERLTSIEDWLEMLHWREIGSPEEHPPLGARAWAWKARKAVETAKGKAEAEAKKPKKVIDIRAELARRQAGVFEPVEPKTLPREPNPKAQKIRAALAERMAGNT